MNTTAFLALIGRIPPQAWDAIIPHGARVSVRNPAEFVALNPQPLPPREAYLVAAAEMANSVAALAVEADVRGEQSGFVSEFIDDWCGTPWPKKWPWPWPGPGGSGSRAVDRDRTRHRSDRVRIHRITPGRERARVRPCSREQNSSPRPASARGWPDACGKSSTARLIACAHSAAPGTPTGAWRCSASRPTTGSGTPGKRRRTTAGTGAGPSSTRRRISYAICG